VEVLTGLAAKDPRDIETRLLLARALAVGGHLDQAAQQLDQATAVAPDDPELEFLLATEYLWLRRVDAAERLFAQVLKARPIPQTHVLIGRAYRDAGEYERARTELQAALLEDAGVRRAHYYLGTVILAGEGKGPERLERARAEFQEELKLAPLDPATNDQLGVVLLDAGRPAQALPVLETAVRGEARDGHLYDLGRCQLALDRPAEAVTSTRRALDLARERGADDEELERIHYQLGRALRIQGKEQEAATELAEAGRLAACRNETAGKETATARVAPVAEASPLSGLTRAQRLELRGRVTAALVRAYFNLGVLQVQGRSAAPAAERFARAADLFAGAADLDPDFPKVQASLGVARFNARQFDAATAPLTRALAADPGDAGLKRMLAMAWLDVREWGKAAALLQDDPARQTDPSVQFAYGLALVRSHRAKEGEEVLTGLLGSQGDSAELSVLLGEAQAGQGKYAAAIESLQRALRLKADVPEANGALGVIYLVQGRLAEAVEQLEAAARLSPDDSTVHDQLGKAYQQLGRSEEAERQFEASRKLKGKERGGTP